MRSIPLLIALAGCLGGGAEIASEGDNDGADLAGCGSDADCVTAASSCCGCPTFARTAGSGECGGIVCEPIECAPTEATCDRGQCRLRCLEVEATRSCESGFVVDETGCTVDRCAPEAAPECELDDDCVRAPADCCGCELGGLDTAVAAADLDAHLAGLECAEPSECPGIDACDPTAEPRCLGGICRLVSESGTDVTASLCGVPDAGSCAADQVCLLNAPEAPPGAGVCRSR